MKYCAFYCALFFAIALLIACGGDDDPTSPNPTTDIGPNGGTINAGSGSVTLLFPAGAVDQEIQVDVTSASGPPDDAGMILARAYDFEPDGTQFQQPVTLTISYLDSQVPAGINEDDLRVCKATGTGWQTVPGSTVDTEANTVTADLMSFSTYGPGDPNGSAEGPLSIAPDEITLTTGGLTTFSAIQEGDDDLDWSVSPSPGGGLVDKDGQYRAPGWPGEFIVTVSRADDSEVTASATVWVVETWSCDGVPSGEEYELVTSWDMEIDGDINHTDRLEGIAVHGGQVWASGGTDEYIALYTTEGLYLGWLGRGGTYDYGTWVEGTTGFHAAGTEEVPRSGQEPSQFSWPANLCFGGDSGLVYVCDLSNERVQIFNGSGGYVNEWSLPVVQRALYIASGPNGDLFCTDELLHQVHRVLPNGAELAHWGGLGEGEGQFRSVGAIAVDASGRVFVCDRIDKDIQVFDSEGTRLGSFGGHHLDQPCATPALSAIAVDTEGFVYVVDSMIKKFTGDGVYLASIERPDGIPWGVGFGIAVDESGNIFFTDRPNAKVWKYRPEGR